MNLNNFILILIFLLYCGTVNGQLQEGIKISFKDLESADYGGRQQRGYFLPGNNWFIDGGGEVKNNHFSYYENLKYYKQGSLSNRFGRLTFVDYLNFYHKIDVSWSLPFALDSDSGKMVISAKAPDKDSEEYNYVVYDLIHDKIEFSFYKETDYYYPISFRNKRQRILARGIWDVNGLGHFAVIEPENEIVFNGKYLKAELSNNGDCILLFSDKMVLEIYDLNQNKLIYEKQIEAWNLQMGVLDEEGFWISYLDVSRGLSPISILLDCSGNEISERVQENLITNGFAFKNDKMAIIMNKVLLFLDEKNNLMCSETEYPVNSSFNDDASQIMVSFNNDLIKIYGTEKLELKGTMLHPDGRSHIILDEKGNFISNTDIRKYMSGKINGESLNIDEFDQIYNKPQEVLKIFGNPDTDYYALLEKSAKIHKNRFGNGRILINKTYSQPKILSALFDGQEILESTDKGEIIVAIDVLDEENSITDLLIKINNVKVISHTLSKSISKGTKQRISERLPLMNGDNLVEIFIINEKGVISDGISRRIISNIKEKQPDLYLLSIGVSDYKENTFNLTYADKDASDLSILYGDKTSIDMEKYEQRFFGYRYYVNNPLIKSGPNEIRHYEDLFWSFPNPELIQVDYLGNYWLQPTNGNNYSLWDFTNSTIKKISLPLIWKNSRDEHILFNKIFKQDPENKFFFFKDHDDQWYRCNITNKHTEKMDMPFKGNQFPLLKGAWATIEFKKNSIINSDETLVVNLLIAKPSGKKWDYTDFKIGFDNVNTAHPELLAVSMDGNYFLISVASDLWMISIKNNVIQKTHLKILDSYYGGSQFYFTEDNRSLSILNISSDFENDYSVVKHYLLNLLNNTLDSQIVHSQFGLKTEFGLNNINGILRWVSFQNPIAVIPQTPSNYFDERAVMTPVSFSAVHCHTLLNEDANIEKISNKLKIISKTARINDQIIVFFAGHGLLDGSLNYFFAPYDMDFKNPKIRGIRYQKIISLMDDIPSQRKLLILDTCHSGEIIDDNGNIINATNQMDNNQRGLKLMRSNTKGIEKISDIIDLLFGKVSSSTGITVLAASSGTDVAMENKELSNGVFTNTFIEELDNSFIRKGWDFYDKKNESKGTLTDELIYKIQKSVFFKTKGKQLMNVREINKQTENILW